jgi:hypothetical protein
MKEGDEFQLHSHRTMTGNNIDMWSEKHVGSLALVRTILGFVNVMLGLIVIAKLFGVI